ncbi:endonuclease domain-containing 1 protein-like [Leucoraja erinacea]|uniref:endonuclease domain-containing 1 protein-like n=1 Tax=Leucoraja erinaceus TaxID=7782 RepID=UPI002453F8B6|nr:endonuclease domain-containing 1 protein-like [Leucoraja erinacea]
MVAPVLLLSLVWAAGYPGTVRGKVVQDFKECGWFFQNNIPPQGFLGRSRLRICQRFKNHYHFATLYRTDVRIPVYSAYRYPCSMGESEAYRPSPWFHEPQIDNQNAGNDMRSSTKARSTKQATDTDYQDSGYDRGHLYPFALNDKESSTATCTLTNAVPEEHGANVKWYQEVEAVAERLSRVCRKSGRTMYLLTGSANPTRTKINNRVSVPRAVWTALCCTASPDHNRDPCLGDRAPPEGQDVLVYNRDFSFAFMKEMKPERAAKHLTVRELQRKLPVDSLFVSCRGTSDNDERQTFEEVEGLIENKIINPLNNTGSPALRPFGYEATAVTFRSVCTYLLVPGHSAFLAVSQGMLLLAPVLHGAATVAALILVNAFSVLINNPRD